MFKINLVPEIQEQKQRVSKTNSTVVTISVIVVAVLGGLVLALSGLLVATKVSLASTQSKIASTQQEVDKYKELEQTVASLENGLAQVKKIFDGQNDWSKLFPHLEAATPNDIAFTQLSLAPGTISANLTGKSVDSLARFVESYKNYQLVSFSGTGTFGDTVTISIDGTEAGKTFVKSNGTWVFSTKMDLTKDHAITATTGNNTTKLTYTAADKTIKSEDGSAVKTQIKYLFSDVIVTSYTKSGNVVFTAKINYDGSLLW